MIKIREKTLADGSKSLYFDIYQPGQKRRAEFLGLYYADPKDRRAVYGIAEERKAERLQELATLAADPGLVSKYGSNFITYWEAKKNANPSRVQGFGTVSKYCGGRLPFDQITPVWWEGFQSYARAKATPLKVNTIYSILGVIKATLNDAAKEGLIRSNPLRSVSVRKIRVERVYLESDELRLLYNTPYPKEPVIASAFLFACFTGLRLSDIRALSWGDVTGGRVRLYQVKTKDFVEIPLSETAAEILGRVNRNAEQIFYGLPQHGEKIGRHLQRWAYTAGVNKLITFHVSRHTFATLLITTGADVFTVQKLLGHNDISSTMVYAKLVDQKRVEAVERLPKL